MLLAWTKKKTICCDYWEKKGLILQHEKEFEKASSSTAVDPIHHNTDTPDN